jgi:hypothetical protein
VERLSDTVRVELGRFGAAGDLAALVDRWPEAVGEGIARNAWPSRIARDGTLHVNTADSVWAFELTHRGPDIASRLGVPGIRFAPGPLASVDRPTPAPTAVEPTREDAERAAGIAAEISDENLRKTVEKVVGLSLANGRSDRPL